MTYRVFATCDIGSEALQLLRDHGYQLEVYPDAAPPARDLILERLRAGLDALITTVRDRIDAQVLETGAAHGLRVVAQYAVGYDNIDHTTASRLKIPVTNTADVLTEATAEFAFFIMGCAARRIFPAEAMLREGRWKTWHPYLPFLGDEVTGRTVAVVGAGRIGRAFIKKAIGFDMNVVFVSPRFDDREYERGVRNVIAARRAAGMCSRPQRFERVGLDEALSVADYVSLHVPLIRSRQGPLPTFHLIDQRRLEQMKPTAFLINTSRGPVVDEDAVARALLEGRIAGAALDVFETEPLPADSPLRDPRIEDRLRLLPHFGSAAHATRLSPDPDVGMAGRTVQAVIDVLDGHYDADASRMPYVVNKDAFR